MRENWLLSCLPHINRIRRALQTLHRITLLETYVDRGNIQNYYIRGAR